MPRFAPDLPENACFKGVWGQIGCKNGGAPKLADPTLHGSSAPLSALSNNGFTKTIFSFIFLPGWHGTRRKRGKQMENQVGKSPSWTGAKMAKNGPKMEKKNGKLPQKSIFFFCFPFFAPLSQLGALFYLVFHLFSPFFSGFWPFSMPCQPGRIPDLLLYFPGSSAQGMILVKRLVVRKATFGFRL